MSEPPSTELGESVVGIGSELGTLVLLSADGSFKENADIIEFDIINKKHFLTSLPVDFFYRFQNVGQDRAKPLGDISVVNIFGGTSKIIPANPKGGNVLPRSIRRFEESWKKFSGQTEDPSAPRPPDPPKQFFKKAWHELKYFAFGRYTANLNLVYGKNNQMNTKAKIVFWVIPWHLILTAGVALIILLIVLIFGIKRYNRLIIKRAQRK